MGKRGTLHNSPCDEMSSASKDAPKVWCGHKGWTRAGGDRHAGLYSPAWNIPAGSRAPDAAWEFIRWAASAEPAAVDLATGGHLEQARLTALTDARAKQRYAADLVETVITTRAFARNERTVQDAWLPVGDAFGAAIADAIAGRASPKIALDDAQQKITAILSKG